MASMTCVKHYWPFSLKVYKTQSVAQSCLSLQDDIGVDANILLLSLLATYLKQRVLDDKEIALADGYISDWRQEVVAPLRKIRRRMKAGLVPVTSAHSESLRTTIKHIEIEAERIQQDVLAKWLDTLPATATATATAVGFVREPELMEVARKVICFYQAKGVGWRQLPQARLVELADVVALAAIPVCAELG